MSEHRSVLSKAASSYARRKQDLVAARQHIDALNRIIRRLRTPAAVIFPAGVTLLPGPLRIEGDVQIRGKINA